MFDVLGYGINESDLHSKNSDGIGVAYLKEGSSIIKIVKRYAK